MKKWLVLLAILFSINLVLAQTIQVPTQQTEKKAGFFENTFGFLKSAYFWYILLGFILVLAILIGIFFLVRYIVKFLKSRNDIFYKLKTERQKLARIQKRYPSKAWYHIEKNTPIRLVNQINGKVRLSSPIAYHRGDYRTHEGNLVISLNLIGNKKWWFFPITDLLIVPNKKSIEISRKTEHGKPVTIAIDNLPQAEDIIQFNENEILIYAENLSNTGQFFIPVLRAKDGKIIDLSLPAYQSLKEVVMGNYLAEQTDDFVKIAKKTMDLNPNLRYQTKAGDSSQSVEIPKQVQQ
jgi:hypothetical protein